MAPDQHPHLRGGSPHRRGTSGTRGVAVILHGGREHSTQPTSPFQLSYIRMLDFYASLRRRATTTAVYLVRFRVRGWNPERPVADPVADARWTLDQISERHPGVPVVLLGHSMGGRTAFAVADHPSVVGVCALAPWLPANEPLPRDIGDRSYVIAHGTSDTMTSAPLSLTYAERLRAAGGHVARFELEGAKHALLDKAGLWRQFATATTLGLVGDGALPPGVAAALGPSLSATPGPEAEAGETSERPDLPSLADGSATAVPRSGSGGYGGLTVPLGTAV